MKKRTVRLGEILEIAKGKKVERLFEYPSRTSRRYLQIEDLRPGAKPKYVEPFGCPLAVPTDVVIAWDGANAGTVSCNLEGYVGSTLAILRPDTDVVYPSFLSRFLEGKFEYLQANSTGATIPHVSKDSLETLQLSLPSLPEQRRIASMLEQADRLRRTRCYALELSDAFIPAVFWEMFGEQDAFAPKAVEEVLAQKSGAIRTGPFGSQLLHSEFTDSGIAVLGIDNAVNNRFEWRERRFITPQKYKELTRYTVFPGDVIITIMGTCGRCAIVPDDIPTAINTKHLCCITLDQKRCLPLYLQGAFLYHPHVRHQLRLANKGAIMDGLNMEIIKILRIPIPPLALQQRFADLVREHERLRETQRESLRQAEHLFQTLLHRAFEEN